MTTSPVSAPQTDRPVLASEVFALQAQAKATDLHVELEPITGRYWIRIGDLAYVYVDRAGLKTLAEQIAEVLA